MERDPGEVMHVEVRWERLGRVHHWPPERYSGTEEQLVDQITKAIGGRLASRNWSWDAEVPDVVGDVAPIVVAGGRFGVGEVERVAAPA